MPLDSLAFAGDLANFQAGDVYQLLTATEATVRGYCNWHIAPSLEETVTIVAPRTGLMLLPTMYLTSVESITEDGVELDLADFGVTRYGLTRLNWHPNRRECYPVTTVVEFTHGYGQVPADVRGVVLSLANRQSNSPGALTQVGQVRYAVDTDAFSAAELGILDRYWCPSL